MGTRLLWHEGVMQVFIKIKNRGNLLLYRIVSW